MVGWFILLSQFGLLGFPVIAVIGWNHHASVPAQVNPLFSSRVFQGKEVKPALAVATCKAVRGTPEREELSERERVIEDGLD